MPLVECVPNVSEGRDDRVIAALAASIHGVAGVQLLDFSADRSHHRSVFTFAGPVAAVGEAALALAAVAYARIDLRHHAGVHPRIGALDVVPFVPLADTTMTVCVDLARTVGAQLAERFAVPIFLYEEAAVRPERRRLEHIRQGGFEQLAGRVKDPAWRPDFGPLAPHPSAGATVVGARRFLVAFNVYLNSDRVEIAKQIAVAIRERDGGLPAVKAIGVMANGRAQVSINLTDFTRTPLQQVVDRIRAIANEAGIAAGESELIGLLPSAALHGTTPKALGLHAFSSDRIIEERLRSGRANS